jgi:hypothetical protein
MKPFATIAHPQRSFDLPKSRRSAAAKRPFEARQQGAATRRGNKARQQIIPNWQFTLVPTGSSATVIV